jgi:hypothetical protein
MVHRKVEKNVKQRREALTTRNMGSVQAENLKPQRKQLPPQRGTETSETAKSRTKSI